MGITWRILIVIITCLIISDIKISASLYKVEDNWVSIKFPQWMEQPIVHFEWGPRQETTFIFTSPFDTHEQIEESEYHY